MDSVLGCHPGYHLCLYFDSDFDWDSDLGSICIFVYYWTISIGHLLLLLNLLSYSSSVLNVSLFVYILN